MVSRAAARKATGIPGRGCSDQVREHAERDAARRFGSGHPLHPRRQFLRHQAGKRGFAHAGIADEDDAADPRSLDESGVDRRVFVVAPDYGPVLGHELGLYYLKEVEVGCCHRSAWSS